MPSTGYTTSGAPAPAGPYSQGVRRGNVLALAGQAGFDPATGELVDGVAAQTPRPPRPGRVPPARAPPRRGPREASAAGGSLPAATSAARPSPASLTSSRASSASSPRSPCAAARSAAAWVPCPQPAVSSAAAALV